MNFAARTYLVSFLFSTFFLFASGDKLAFFSDPFSLWLSVTAISVLLWPAVCVLSGLLLAAVGASRIAAGLCSAALALLGATAIWGFIGNDKYTDLIWAPPATVLGLFILITVLMKGPSLETRVTSLAKVVLPLAGAFLAGGVAYNHGFARSTATAAPPGKHLILLVIDGFPATSLRPYNAQADASLSEGRTDASVFLNARTNRTYTNGFFNLLYSGDLTSPDGGRPGLRSILHTLQEKGVKTRLITFHPNGLPQSNQIVGLRGLRSSFLTEHYAWIPSVLGLDYDVFLDWPQARDYLGRRLVAAHAFLNGGFDEASLWRDFVPSQISEMVSAQQPSLLVVHVSHSEHIVQAIADSEQGADLVDFYKTATESGYRYEPGDEETMRVVRQKYEDRTAFWSDVTHRLAQLVEKDESTILIATADHGTILNRGKIWYGHHPDEEVTRVPLVTYGTNLPPEISDPVDTMDLAHTLGRHLLGEDTEFAVPGRYLFDEISNHRDVPVLTSSDPSRNERFLIVYSDKLKYRLNVHPEGAGEAFFGPFPSLGEPDVLRPLPHDHPGWETLRHWVDELQIQTGALPPASSRK